MQILIADDAPDIAEVVAFSARLSWPECTVITAGNGMEALAAFADTRPDLLILDVTMPPPDGFEVCRRIRVESDVPILMLTVRDTTLDKVRGFDLGVDDYLTKPFDHLELMARMQALMRRTGLRSTAGGNTLVVGELALNNATRQVTLHKIPISLTSTEYRLLEFLARHAGQVLPHQSILEEVWGDAYRNEVHYLKVFVRRLRQKLGDTAAQQRYIQTEWGIGYRFAVP